jgi:branched-chain amino acid transport system substrate-binding protein
MPTPNRALATWLLPLLALGCGGKAEPPPVVIGHLSPLSGPQKAAGASARQGILLAVEDANRDPEEKGAGRRVLVLHTDTQGSPTAFGAEVTRLVKVNKVAALLGGMTSADLKQFLRLTPPGVLLISPRGSPGNEPPGNAVYFTGLSIGDQGKALARFAARKKFRHVILLYREDDQYRALADAFREQFLQIMASKSPRSRGRIAGAWRFGKEAPIQDRARRIPGPRDGGARNPSTPVDAVVVAGKPGDVLRLREALDSGRSAIPILFGGGEGSLAEFLEDPPSGGDIFLVTAFSPDADFDQTREFVRRFQKRFGEPPDVHAALAYDGARLLFAALRQATETDSASVEKALSELKDFPSLTGPVALVKNHQARRVAFVLRLDHGQAARVARFGPEE